MPALTPTAAAASETPAPRESLLRVDLSEFRFADRVFADVSRIRRTAAGRAMFRRLRDCRSVITIEKPDPPTDPPNAWTLRRDDADGRLADVVVAYDPADWPNPAFPDCATSDVILFGRLLDAACLHGAEQAASGQDAPVADATQAYVRERAAVPRRLAAAGT